MRNQTHEKYLMILRIAAGGSGLTQSWASEERPMKGAEKRA
jgi:hypothetical protein